MFIRFQNHEPSFLFSFRDLLFYFTFKFITYLELNSSFFFYGDSSWALYHLMSWVLWFFFLFFFFPVSCNQLCHDYFRVSVMDICHSGTVGYWSRRVIYLRLAWLHRERPCFIDLFLSLGQYCIYLFINFVCVGAGMVMCEGEKMVRTIQTWVIRCAQ